MTCFQVCKKKVRPHAMSVPDVGRNVTRSKATEAHEVHAWTSHTARMRTHVHNARCLVTGGALLLRIRASLHTCNPANFEAEGGSVLGVDHFAISQDPVVLAGSVAA